MRRALSLLCLLWIVGQPLYAQSIRESLRSLFRLRNASACGADALLCISASSGISTAEAFSTGVNASAGALINFVGSSAALAVANVPSPSTSGGTPFRLSEAGVLVPNKEKSKGPIFGEWALTLGRHRFLVGANVSQQQFTTLRGQSTKNLTFNIAQTDFAPAPLGSPTFEQTYLSVSTHFALDSRTITGFATYGLLDAVDIGVTVPLIRNAFSGYTDAVIVPPAGSTASPYNFGGPAANPRLTDRAVVAPVEATGIGDIAARVKWRLTGENNRLALALFVEGRFPTGDEDQLFGTGKFAARGLGVASLDAGSGFSPHLNLGYFHRPSSSSVPLRSAFLFTAGADQRLGSFLTLAADVLGQLPTGSNQFTSGPVTIQTGPSTTVSFQSSNVPSREDTLLDGSLGAKITVGAVTAIINGLIPLNQTGLRPDALLTAGLEFHF